MQSLPGKCDTGTETDCEGAREKWTANGLPAQVIAPEVITRYPGAPAPPAAAAALACWRCHSGLSGVALHAWSRACVHMVMCVCW